MNKKQIFTACCIAVLLNSCGEGSSKEDGDVHSTISATGDSEEEIKASLDEIEKEEKELNARITTIRFDKTSIDFGKIKEDTENKASFTVTNTGKIPLVIEKVDVSCGCTTAQKPEKPILPGKSDKIEIIFHPKIGQLDQQDKTITVTANTKPETTELGIKAFVVKK